MINYIQKILSVSLILLCLLSCQVAPPAGSDVNTLNIEVQYRERIMLPPNAELTVSLEDISKMDVASTIIAKTEMSINSAPPYHLTLNYLSATVTNSSRYNLRAVIRHNNQLLFANTTHVDLQKTDASGIISITVNQATPHIHKTLSLSGTQWQLISLAKQKITTSEGQKSPNLHFDLKNQTISGFAGCNHFFASMEKNQHQLSIGNIGATMMMCEKEMSLETQYLSALAKASHYSLKQGKLVLYDNNNQFLAIFSR